MLQRDEFISKITAEIDTNKNIMFLSADFGAEALDKLRLDHPNNFVHCGISEQAMIDVATGLALEDKTVFVYAMAPFLSLRAIEQIKCGPAMMNLPICIISVGVGLGYADSGPTHYTNEEFACLRSIAQSSIYTASDSKIAKLLAEDLIKKPKFAYVRLDRHELKDIEGDVDISVIHDGYRIIGNPSKNKCALVSHGKMTHRCLEIFNEYSDDYFLVDIIRSKPFPEKLADILSESKNIVVADEQTAFGSLGSAIFEFLSSNNIHKKIAIVSLPDEFIFENGGREYLLDNYGLSKNDIIDAANKLNSDN
jgi:transketolase